MNFWRPIVSAFNPRHPLDLEEVDVLYVERPKTASRRILEELDFDQHNGPLFLLCGSRGSGKTTELAKVHKVLCHQRLIIEIELQNALPSPLSAVALAVALGLQGLMLVRAWNGGKPDTTTEQKFQNAVNSLGPSTAKKGILDVGKILEGLSTTLTTAGVALGLPPVAVMGGVATALAKGLQLNWDTNFGKTAVEASEGARLRVASAINDVFTKLHALSGRPVLVLADGLDKLSDQNQLVQVLNDPKLFAELNVPLVLTGPINLLHSTEFNALRNIAIPAPLFNIVVHGSSELVEQGIGLFQQLVQRRCQRHALPNGWISRTQLEDLARGCGGSVRDFIDLVRSAAKLAARSNLYAISDDHVESAIKDLRHFLQLPLNEQKIRQLRFVLRTQRPTADPHCEELLFNNYILCYPNGNLWYRPHEVLVPWLESLTLDSDTEE